MLITVIYRNDRMGMVDSSQLDELIHLNNIKKFLRSQGWVTIGVDPIRRSRDDYKGREKRQHSPLAKKAQVRLQEVANALFG